MDGRGSTHPFADAVDLSALRDRPKDVDEHFEGFIRMAQENPDPRMWWDDDEGHADEMFGMGHVTALEVIVNLLADGHASVSPEMHDQIARVALIDRRGVAWLDALAASGAERDELLVAYLAVKEAKEMHGAMLMQVVSQVMAVAARAAQHEAALAAVRQGL